MRAGCGPAANEEHKRLIENTVFLYLSLSTGQKFFYRVLKNRLDALTYIIVFVTKNNTIVQSG